METPPQQRDSGCRRSSRKTFTTVADNISGGIKKTTKLNGSLKKKQKEAFSWENSDGYGLWLGDIHKICSIGSPKKEFL